MAISRRDKKVIFNYLLEAGDGLVFGRILRPDPEPVRSGGITSLKSVRKVESTEEELFEYWQELGRIGAIRSVDRLNPELYVLTDKGRRLAEAEDYDLALASLNIADFVSDEELAKCVVPAFGEQRYNDAVFGAFKHLEERVRRRAKLAPENVGASLVVEALHHERGRLKITSCETKAEEEGVFLLFKGAIQLLKNPSSHRTVNWADPKRAAEAILLADFLLGLLNTADWR
jgi:uncharacterized protein (TIGR02391 family)